MSVMSLTYRKPVRGLIREEQGGVKKMCTGTYTVKLFLKRVVIKNQKMRELH